MSRPATCCANASLVTDTLGRMEWPTHRSSAQALEMTLPLGLVVCYTKGWIAALSLLYLWAYHRLKRAGQMQAGMPLSFTSTFPRASEAESVCSDPSIKLILASQKNAILEGCSRTNVG